MFKAAIFAVLTALLVVGANTESHTVTLTNKCGRGTPTLVHGASILSTGASHTVDGPLNAAIAYLQTGDCGLSGEGCTIVEFTLANPTVSGALSSADISLLPPAKFSVASGFSYSNGCEDKGADCNGASCPDAFRDLTNNQAQIACQAENVNIDISFCE